MKALESRWRTEHLADHRLIEAWPLVRLGYPGLSSEQWLARARRVAAHDGGVMALQNPAGYIFAICAHSVDEPGPNRAELTLSLVAYVRWNGSVDPLGALLAGIEKMARDRACNLIRVDGHALVTSDDRARWEHHGYRQVGAHLQKQLLSPPANSNDTWSGTPCQ